MMDFLTFDETMKNGSLSISPDYLCKKNNDLMIRGHRFYAIWDAENGIWSDNPDVATRLIDEETAKRAEERRELYAGKVETKKLLKASSGALAKWHKYCEELATENFKPLNQKVMFSNSKIKKTDYASMTLDYPLVEGPIDAYDRLMTVLYSPEERHKIEWAIGAIVAGDNKTLQKFFVLYGGPGTGKSTVLNIIQMLFDGYYTVFDAESLGDKNSQFALQPFVRNPVVGIQHDGDLSKIETNTRLNSLVSHEYMVVNPKGSPSYTDKFNCILFMGTNKPVRITDAKSGILRRLVDISPTGEKVSFSEYKQLMSQIKFELGAIAAHCKDIYLNNPDYYDNYVPTTMMGASNDFYNFVSDYYFTFRDANEVTMKQAWEMYKTYCADARVLYPFSQRVFKEELKNYFDEFYTDFRDDTGTHLTNVYYGFKTDKFRTITSVSQVSDESGWLAFNSENSLFDSMARNYAAQYASASGTPSKRWADNTTKLKDIDTRRLHYVMVPINHIVIDFDKKDESGNKSFELNLKEANKWPATYAELSKSGAGIHLHYIYEGDPNKLASIYNDDPEIEIKVFSGNSSLRRKLTKCNDIPVTVINSGLPLKGEKPKMATKESIMTERAIRTLISRNLKKEIHPGTKPSIDFIYKILEDAYNDGVKYDISNMEQEIMNFASKSTNHAEYCKALVRNMKFKSDEQSEVDRQSDQLPIAIFDVEVFPNLFLVNHIGLNEDDRMVRLINPDPTEITKMIQSNRLVGFNNRRYDNHIEYGKMMGYSEEQLYNLSQRIVQGDPSAFFGEAYNLSYTDIYDFSSKKQSLKKWEIELWQLGLATHHKELGLPWDKPVPKEMWQRVSEYCDNDVYATRALWYHLQGDFKARQILAAAADSTVNDTTNSLTTKLIFGKTRNPQDQFNYRDLSKPVRPTPDVLKRYPGPFRVFDDNGNPCYRDYILGEELPAGYSIMPFFPGYVFDQYAKGIKSTYMGEDIGEGGRVYAEPGMYFNVKAEDVASMHPSSIIAEWAFGPYTKNFAELKQARLYIKHKDFKKAGELLGGKLKPYLTDESMAKDLSQALKIAINSVYGLTSAKFTNPFKDPRNLDNFIAKRGALFMTKLKAEVEKRGFKVAHIKTDCIKIPNATKDIEEFVVNFGKEYGYEFELENDFSRFCLVNDAVYIAQTQDGEWEAVGTQFQVPYVYKSLFSHEPIVFTDYCETKSVSKGDLYLDMNEGLPEGEHNMVFIGRVGAFCPIQQGRGGGELFRVVDGKNYAVSGTKGYRWLEAEEVQKGGKEADIDVGYYEHLVDEAKKEISKWGDFDYFLTYSPEPFELDIKSDELPF